MKLNLSENSNLGRWRVEATFPGSLELLFSWSCGWKEEVKAKGPIRVRSLIDFPL